MTAWHEAVQPGAIDDSDGDDSVDAMDLDIEEEAEPALTIYANLTMNGTSHPTTTTRVRLRCWSPESHNQARWKSSARWRRSRLIPL
jgi:hypothetical protein